MSSDADTAPRSIFAEPRRLTSEANRALTAWQTTVCSLLQENWQALLGTSIGITAGRTDSSTAIRVVNNLADPGYAARLKIGPTAFCSLVAFSSRMVQVLVNDMLGTPSAEWPEVRDLTPVETSMAELLFGEITRSISQAWPEIRPLECELESVISRPKRSRFFPPEEPIVRTRIALQTAMGTEEAIWLMPQQGLTTIGIAESHDSEAAASPAPELRTLAEHLPIQLVAELGKTTMRLSELDNLSVGDYLTLDQAVYQPLEVMVDGQMQWLGHPCRLGTRQGFQIIASKKD
ncbi:MAG: FliM/FliN family flagellar motor switch protein [Fuerstiella sp.]